MGAIFTLLGIVASVILYFTDSSILFWMSIVSTVGCLWSWGVMHNYATDSIQHRKKWMANKMREEDVPNEEIEEFLSKRQSISKSDAQQAPNWITHINMLFSLGCVVFLIAGIIQII